jgi:hypothetical protein
MPNPSSRPDLVGFAVSEVLKRFLGNEFESTSCLLLFILLDGSLPSSGSFLHISFLEAIHSFLSGD